MLHVYLINFRETVIIIHFGGVITMKQIGLICGSLRKNSYNRIIGENLTKMNDTVSF